MILSTAHFPPIQYFCKIIDQKNVQIEARENYQKQSYRNRFRILAANGPLDLSIPVLKGRSPGQSIRDIRIDYTESWNVIHKKTIKSAYSHSAFYEFYIDLLIPYWEKKWDFLYDLNLEILFTLLEILEINTDISETDEYIDNPESDDYREIIHPKRSYILDSGFKPIPYTQVFKEKHGFIPNLSVIDLIFQTGPGAAGIIKSSIQH